MDSNGSGKDDGSPSSKSSDNLANLTQRMGNLWWGDEPSDEISPDSLFSNSIHEGDGVWVDIGKYQESHSIQGAVEKIWAKELYEMNSGEREDMNNEIHGVRSSRTVDETPQLVSDSIIALRHHIEQRIDVISEGGGDHFFVADAMREAYQRIVALVPREEGTILPYIHTQKFLMKFLRASFFDIKKTGKRYFRCLDLMYEMFGDIALQRPLMLTDLTIREQEYLRKGKIQLLPCRDRIGRRIFVYSGREDKSFTVLEKSRASMYLFDVCSEDETTQKLGMVLVSTPRVETGHKPFGNGFGSAGKEFYRKFRNGTALRTSAIHFTGPSSFIYNVGRAYVLLAMKKADRKIIRFHQGTVTERNHSLRSYGIPIDDVPLTHSGHIKNTRVADFMRARKSIEDARQEQFKGGQTTFEDPGIECPEVNCVVFGKRIRSNTANLEFRNIIKVMEIDREIRSNRRETLSSVKDYVGGIIQIAQSPEHNLRFVYFDKKTALFEEMTDPTKRFNVIYQSIRDLRKRKA